MTFYIFHNDQRAEYENFCFFEKAFTEEECQKIIAKGESLPFVDSKVGGSEHGGIHEEIRKSKNSWIDFEPDTAWLYDKMGYIARGANDARYKFQLTGFMEHLQYTVYEEGGSHYQLHTDHGKGAMAQRKLSVVILLSDPEDYEGGELEFFKVGAQKFPKGTMIVFPSFELHGVRPVTKGVRKSLVAWISGEPFR